MIIYLIFLFILVTPFCVLAHSRWAAWYMACVIFVISAMRYDVGFDYETYFRWASDGIDYYQALTLEPLPKGMLEFAYYSGEPQYFFVLSSLIVVGLFSYSFMRYSQMPALSLLVFFCMPLLFLSSLGLVRQYMGAAFVFFALTVLQSRPKSALAVLLFAGLLHYSAWLIVFLWPVLRWFDRPISTLWILSVLLSAPLLSFAIVDLVAPRVPLYAHYFQHDLDSGLKLILFYYIVALGVLWMRYRGAAMPSRSFNLFMLGVVLLGLFGPINQVVGRIAYFFIPFIALLLPNCISLFRPAMIARFIAAFLLAGVLLMQLHIAATNPEKDPYQPYLVYSQGQK